MIYYTDERNDEFSTAQITPKKIDGSYVYIREGLFRRFTRFFWYRVIATPVAFLYVKLAFGQKTEGKNKFRECKKTGYFMYGNHTQDIGDAFIPNVINFPKSDYVIVHPNNVSIPAVGRVAPSLGALPIPDGIDAYRNFTAAIDRRIAEGNAIVVYPEAHIWPYYTGIRPFPDTSFDYPARLGVPVYCFTNTYRKRRFSKRPRIVTVVDGPFFPDPAKSRRENRRDLRETVYRTMLMRAESSDHVQIEYIRKEKDDG